jgi:hypothetical protein
MTTLQCPQDRRASVTIPDIVTQLGQVLNHPLQSAEQPPDLFKLSRRLLGMDAEFLHRLGGKRRQRVIVVGRHAAVGKHGFCGSLHQVLGTPDRRAGIIRHRLLQPADLSADTGEI